jgi:hypothetical protein
MNRVFSRASDGLCQFHGRFAGAFSTGPDFEQPVP